MMGKRAGLFYGISMIIVVLAILLSTWVIPLVIRKQIQKNIQLENSSIMFENWRKLPMPLTFKVNFFNVTNPEEVNMGGKPKLAEVGPFVYDEYREKRVLGYGANDTIKYMLKKTFYFNATASGSLSDEDELTVINFAYLGAILSVNEIMPGLVSMVNGAFEQMFSDLNDPFLRVKVKDLLFDGIFLNCNGTHSAIGLVCARIRSEQPRTMRIVEDGSGFYFSTFGHMNRTEIGPFEMVRGTENINELGHILSYQGKTSMNVWRDKYCGQINGSDASIFPPIDESKVPERLYIFEPEICRSLYVSLAGMRKISSLSAYYYEISESALAAKSANPGNRCFCRKNWSANHDGCLIMGLLNLMPCQGAPAIASLPHFYLASEEIREYFEEGIKPDKEKHNTYVYIDPVTGVVLEGLQRFQFNVELRNLAVPQLENVTTGLFPLLWLEEGAKIPPNIIKELEMSHNVINYVNIGRWTFLALSIILLVISILYFLLTKTGSMWPRNGNSVSFILNPRTNDKSQ